MAIIPPISGAGSAISSVGSVRQAGAGQRVAPTEDAGFADTLTSALDNLDAAHKNTDALARAAATGDLNRIEDLVVATTETQLATQMTVAFRNKAVESFNEIMRMPL